MLFDLKKLRKKFAEGLLIAHYINMYSYTAGLAQWIGRVTPNVVRAGSKPTVETKKI